MKCCCRDMEKAFESGTDNEMYGALARDMDGYLMMGCDLPPIVYCPWCAKETGDTFVKETPLERENATCTCYGDGHWYKTTHDLCDGKGERCDVCRLPITSDFNTQNEGSS